MAARSTWRHRWHWDALWRKRKNEQTAWEVNQMILVGCHDPPHRAADPCVSEKARTVEVGRWSLGSVP